MPGCSSARPLGVYTMHLTVYLGPRIQAIGVRLARRWMHGCARACACNRAARKAAHTQCASAVHPQCRRRAPLDRVDKLDVLVHVARFAAQLLVGRHHLDTLRHGRAPGCANMHASKHVACACVYACAHALVHAHVHVHAGGRMAGTDARGTHVCMCMYLLAAHVLQDPLVSGDTRRAGLLIASLRDDHLAGDIGIGWD